MMRYLSAILILTLLTFGFGCEQEKATPKKVEKPAADQPENGKGQEETTFRGKPADITVEVKTVEAGGRKSDIAIRSIVPKPEAKEANTVDYPPNAKPYEQLYDDELVAVFRFPEYAEPRRMTAQGYGVIDKDDKAALVIDPGVANVRMIEFWLQKMGVKLAAIAATHGHLDHTGGIALLKMRYPDAVYYAPEGDAEWMTKPDNQTFGGHQADWPPTADKTLKEGDLLHVGNTALEAIAVPGHTVGSLIYALPEQLLVFSGDVLFKGSIGRTDLPHSLTMKASIATIKKAFGKLDPGMRVQPGHGVSFILGDELKHNPFITGGKGNNPK